MEASGLMSQSGVKGPTTGLKTDTHSPTPPPSNGEPFEWAFLALLDFQIEIRDSTAP